MTSFTNRLKNELMGDGWFGLLFITLGLLTQLASFIWAPDTTLSPADAIISLVCGMFGIVGVVLYSQKKLSGYIFSFVQLFLYVYLAAKQHLWGQIAQNVFYFVTMIGGMYIWVKHYRSSDTDSEVDTLQLSRKWFGGILAATVILIGVLYYVLRLTNDPQPFIDAFTTVPAFVAQILLMLRYRENWVFWAILNVASVVLWARAENWCLMIQYIFWTINCAYGYHLWRTTQGSSTGKQAAKK